ncbi:MAG: NAD(P)/FAD-dependent oxidoreductase [Cetobacterium sp.]|uniref:NAD(P)/FAD-dependent oxidoreductase n=1 Tax=Cetobacterium sp. TaxID=2071632 RepID=UPI003F35E318
MEKNKKNMYDVIIVGGGPAGASAAVYAASRGYKAIILEKNEIGGTIGKVSSVTHYLSVDKDETGKSFKEKLENQLAVYGVEIFKEEVLGFCTENSFKKVMVKSGEVYYAKSIILANGTTQKELNIPGEKELVGKGICFNPSKEGRNYVGKDIFVIGGADGAIKEAIYLAQFAKSLSIIHFEEKLGTIPEFKNKLEKLDNIKLYLQSRLTKIDGKDYIQKLEITDVKTKSVKIIEAEGAAIFRYIGATPNTEGYQSLELEGGFIKVDTKMKTNIEGVFAAGDICSKDIRQVATAVYDGTVAGINVSNYLKTI